MARPNKHHEPAVTRIVIRNHKFKDQVPAARCKPDEHLALIIVNKDNTDYTLKLDGFLCLGDSSKAVTQNDLFKSAMSHAIPANEITMVKRTTKAAGNWGTGNGQFPFTTYKYTLQLFNANGTGSPLDELDPDFDITP